jgi:hypothetical protein
VEKFLIRREVFLLHRSCVWVRVARERSSGLAGCVSTSSFGCHNEGATSS